MASGLCRCYVVARTELWNAGLRAVVSPTSAAAVDGSRHDWHLLRSDSQVSRCNPLLPLSLLVASLLLPPPHPPALHAPSTLQLHPRPMAQHPPPIIAQLLLLSIISESGVAQSSRRLSQSGENRLGAPRPATHFCPSPSHSRTRAFSH